MSSVAVGEVPSLPTNHDSWRPWAFLIAFIAIWVGGIYVAVDRAQITREETIQALRSSSFDIPLPAEVDLQLSTDTNDPPSPVTFADLREMPHASGGAVTISYFIKGSESTAEMEFAALEDSVEDLLSREPLRGFQPFRRASVTTLPLDSVCLTGPFGASCEFVVGEVGVEVVSNLPAFDPNEGYHLDALSRAAYRHIAGILHRE